MRLLVLLIFVLLLLAFSCMENSAPSPLVEVQFQLLNTDGEPTTVFQEGENVYFNLEIKNNSGEDQTLIFIEPNDFNLIQVFQIQNKEKLFVGSPLLHIAQTKYIHGYLLPNNHKFLFKIAWSGDEEEKIVPNNWRIDQIHNDFLDKGKYFTIATVKVEFRNFTLEDVDFRIDFEIK